MQAPVKTIIKFGRKGLLPPPIESATGLLLFDRAGTSCRWTGKIYKLLCMNRYAKTTLKLFVATSNSNLPTNFQFEAKSVQVREYF